MITSLPYLEPSMVTFLPYLEPSIITCHPYLEPLMITFPPGSLTRVSRYRLVDGAPNRIFRRLFNSSAVLIVFSFQQYLADPAPPGPFYKHFRLFNFMLGIGSNHQTFPLPSTIISKQFQCYFNVITTTKLSLMYYDNLK